MKVSALKEPQSNGRLMNWSLKYNVVNTMMELAEVNRADSSHWEESLSAAWSYEFKNEFSHNLT